MQQMKQQEIYLPYGLKLDFQHLRMLLDNIQRYVAIMNCYSVHIHSRLIRGVYAFFCFSYFIKCESAYEDNQKNTRDNP